MNRFLRLFTNNVITLHPESPKSSWKQHALKGQKLLAQGNALGIITINKAPCKGKIFTKHLVLKLLPLQGDRLAGIKNPGRCPGLEASALSGRVELTCGLDNKLNHGRRAPIYNKV